MVEPDGESDFSLGLAPIRSHLHRRPSGGFNPKSLVLAREAVNGSRASSEQEVTRDDSMEKVVVVETIEKVVELVVDLPSHPFRQSERLAESPVPAHLPASKRQKPSLALGPLPYDFYRPVADEPATPALLAARRESDDLDPHQRRASPVMFGSPKSPSVGLVREVLSTGPASTPSAFGGWRRQSDGVLDPSALVPPRAQTEADVNAESPRDSRSPRVVSRVGKRPSTAESFKSMRSTFSFRSQHSRASDGHEVSHGALAGSTSLSSSAWKTPTTAAETTLPTPALRTAKESGGLRSLASRLIVDVDMDGEGRDVAHQTRQKLFFL